MFVYKTKQRNFCTKLMSAEAKHIIAKTSKTRKSDHLDFNGDQTLFGNCFVNLCYFFVSNQNYKFVHSSDPIFGNEKNYRTEHFLQEVIFQIRTSDRAAVSVLKETSKQRMKIRTERTSLKILKNFSSKHTSKKKRKTAKVSSCFCSNNEKNTC